MKAPERLADLDETPDPAPTVRRPGHVPVLMRTRYLAERGPLLRTGAKEVVAEEVVSATAIIDRMLRLIGVQADVIDERVRKVREETSGG